MKRILSLLIAMIMALGCVSLPAMAEGGNVAKVGNTEYATIDEAIAAWTNGTTLTLLADVTLPDVITLKSTEHHILDLGTYTMTAAADKNAFVIQACGNGSAERSTITINADATNPGGINAGNKCVVYYKYADGGISTEDRPIIKINGGIFTGSNSSFGTAGIYTIGTEARKCATLNISGGTFNCSINGSGKSKLIISGGTFNYSVGSQGDSTANRLISGGTFKSFGFMTADSNNTKFWFGTSMGNSNVGLYVDDNGYIVVGGSPITESGDAFEASSANYSGASSLLQYSSAKNNGLYYTSVEEAFADNNKTTGSVTVYVDELDMTGINYKGTIVVPEEGELAINFTEGTTPAWTVGTSVEGKEVIYTDSVENGVVTRIYKMVDPAVAKIGETAYISLADAVAAAKSGDTITILQNGEYELPLFANKELTFKGANKEGVIINDAPDERAQGWNGSTFHFENLTAKGATENNHGLANGVVAVTYKDCNVNNLRFLYATDTVSFERCTFNANGVEHSFWTYGASDINVTECTFNYTDRAVNCYSASGAEHETAISFSDCKFNYTGIADAPEGAVEINSGSVKSIDVSFDECTVPEKGAMWFNSQWDNKEGANTVVKVEGAQVWPVNYVAQTMDADGNVVGSYSDFESAIAAATADVKITRIEILSDYEQTTILNTSNYYNISGNLTIGVPAGETHTVAIKPNGNDSIAVKVEGENASLTIGEGLTINWLDVVADGFWTNNEALIINGTLYAKSLKCWTSNNGITVGPAGKVILGNGDGQFDLNYGNGTVNITGNGNETTPQFKAGYTTTQNNSNGATLNLKDTYFEAGAWFKVNGSNGTINVDNSVLKVSGGDGAGSLTIANTGNAINLTNGSKLQVANLTVSENNSLTLGAGCSIEATTISGAGEIIIDAADMTAGNIATISGNASGFTGTIQVINNDSLEASVDENGNIVLTEVVKTYVATVNGVGYETLQTAIDAVKNGETIEFAGNITEELVTIEKGTDVAFTIDGKNNKFTGEFEIGIGENITIQNINFVATAEISPEYFIDSMDRNSNCVLTIQNCTFTDIDYTTTAIGTHQPAKVVINECTANGVASLMQNQGGYDITVTNATIEGKRGISLGSVIGAKVEKVTINAADDKYGIRLNGENNNNTVTIKDCTIKAFIPVVVRKAQVENYNLIFDGTNTMTAVNTDDIWCAIGSSEYETNGTMPTAQTGKVKVTLNDAKLDAKGVYGAYKAPVAKIGETTYATLEEAFKAASDGCTIDILSDVVIDYKWDCRDYATNGSHSQFKETVTINGNNHIIKFTGTISDSNWNTIFRFEENATVKNLTVDISEATGAQRVITAKKSLDVDKLTIVGSAKYGIIFGEGAAAADLADAEISIANSNLNGTRRAISDNEGGKDVKSVKVTGNTLNADVCVSALETVTFTDNNMTGGYVDIRSYTSENTLDVTATKNTLKENTENNYNYIKAGGTVDAQEGFVLPWDGVTISNLEELKMFRDAVNTGDTYEGKTVTLTADIDLAGENWTPIGTIYNEHGFMGNFDGQNYKIMNLTITDPALDSDGYAYAGLFGIAEGIDEDNQNFIKNLTIENVTINTNGHIVAAAIAYPYYTIVDNIKVCGKISISGGDYTAGVLAYTRRCIKASNLYVEGGTDSTISGRQVVGGVISDIQMNGGLTADYSNFNVSGVVISGTKNVGGISGIISGQTLDTCSVKNVSIICDDARVGIVSGSLGSASVISNVTIENVTGASSIVGADYDTGKVVEAKIGDKYYKTLADALKANVEGEITLLAPIVVNAGETLTLNKNVTITYTSNVPGEDMITNRGNLVIDGATLVYANTDTTANNVTVSTISCEPGSTLEVKSGTVQNDSANNSAAGIYAYAIDLITNGNLGDVKATISGGKVISTNYMAIRQFVNGEVCKNTLTVAGGTIKGATRGINIQLKNNMAYTTISGGKIIGGDYSICFLTTSENVSVTGGEFEGNVWYSGTEGFISGGTFSVKPDDAYAAEGYVFEENEDGTWGVTEKETVELFEFYGMNLDLESSMKANFYILASHFKGTDYYAKIVHSSATGDIERIVYFADWEDNGSYKQISYTDLAAKNMADTVTIAIFDGDDNQVSAGYVRSIKTYAEDYIRDYAGTDDKWVTPFVDMLNYGAEAQRYFDYNTENLANAGIGDYQNYATQSDVELEKDVATFGPVHGANLDLENKIVYNGYFSGVTDDMTAEISYTDHLDNDISYHATLVPNGSYHQVAVDTLVIADANQLVTITVKDSNGDVYAYRRQSINGYLHSTMDDINFIPLAKAMAKFTKSAHTALH